MTPSHKIYTHLSYTLLSFFLSSFVLVFFMQRILQEFLIRLPFRSLTVVDYCNVVLFYSLFSSVWRWWNANWCTKFECTSFTWPIYHLKWFWPKRCVWNRCGFMAHVLKNIWSTSMNLNKLKSYFTPLNWFGCWTNYKNTIETIEIHYLFQIIRAINTWSEHPYDNNLLL